MCWCQKLNRRTQSWYLMLPVLQEQALALLGPGSQLGITRNDPWTAAEPSLLHSKKHLDNTNTTVFEFGVVLCGASSWMIFAGLFQLRAFCDHGFVTGPVALKCRSSTSMSAWTRAHDQAALWSLISLQFTLWMAQTVFLLERRNQGKLLSEQKWRSEASRVAKVGMAASLWAEGGSQNDFFKWLPQKDEHQSLYIRRQSSPSIWATCNICQSKELWCTQQFITPQCCWWLQEDAFPQRVLRLSTCCICAGIKDYTVGRRSCRISSSKT